MAASAFMLALAILALVAALVGGPAFIDILNTLHRR